MKTKVVQYVEFFKLFKFFKSFMFFKFPGSQLLSDVQTFLFTGNQEDKPICLDSKTKVALQLQVCIMIFVMVMLVFYPVSGEGVNYTGISVRASSWENSATIKGVTSVMQVKEFWRYFKRPRCINTKQKLPSMS